MKKFKVGVTGGGFVGSELCKDLLWNGYEVLCIDNLYLPCDHLFGLIDHSVNNKIPFSFERFDITDLRLDKVFADCDAIIHTAGIVGAPKVDRDPKLAHEYN